MSNSGIDNCQDLYVLHCINETLPVILLTTSLIGAISDWEARPLWIKLNLDIGRNFKY